MTDEKLIQTPVGLPETHRKHCSRFGNLSAFIRNLILDDINRKFADDLIAEEKE